jgi:hypothetical protein
MKRFLGLFAGLILAAPAAAADRPDPAALAVVIDRHVGDRLVSEQVPPAPRADDAEFFRRANLVLAGRIPVPSEVRLFLADTGPDKRRKAVEKLLASPAYANHLTTTWRGWLLPEAVTDFQVAGAVPGFEAWLRARIQANMPFDQFVTELLTAPLDGRRAAPRGAEFDDPDGATNPLAFYTAKEGKPENLAAATSRLFMGVQLECAQCHDHPFAKWSRDQFWGLAAFYAGVERPNGGALKEALDRRELSIPNAEPPRTVPATFLDDKEPEWRFKKSPRVTLAAWLTAPDNPFFARAAVNRLWGFVFGVGIVDPIDDFSDEHRPSHPELLDVLAKAFVESGFDVKFILKAIVLSETFQRSSTVTHERQKDPRLFARFPVQGLTPEQLYDSVSVVIGTALEGPGGMYLQTPGAGRRQFLEAFALTGRKTENPTTIIQALTLMNGGLVGGATTVESSRTLAAVVELPGLSPAERVEALYFAVLSRPPRPEELRRAVGHVEAGGDKSKERYADVMWALLNGVEFRTNH